VLRCGSALAYGHEQVGGRPAAVDGAADARSPLAFAREIIEVWAATRSIPRTASTSPACRHPPSVVQPSPRRRATVRSCPLGPTAVRVALLAGNAFPRQLKKVLRFAPHPRLLG
jgi:hypothetical protein